VIFSRVKIFGRGFFLGEIFLLEGPFKRPLVQKRGVQGQQGGSGSGETIIGPPVFFIGGRTREFLRKGESL